MVAVNAPDATTSTDTREGPVRLHVIGVVGQEGGVRAAATQDRLLASLAAQGRPAAAVCVLRTRDASADPPADRRVHFYDGPAALAQSLHAVVAGTDADVIVLVADGAWCAPSALDLVANEFARDESLDALYGDAVVTTGDGETLPLRLPRWSPERLRGSDYAVGLLAVRNRAWHRVGGVKAGTGTAWRHDLLLRGLEGGWRVTHVPEPVALMGERPATGDAGDHVVVVRGHLERTGVPATVTTVPRSDEAGWSGVLRLHRRPPAGTHVSVVVPTAGATAEGAEHTYLEDLVASIEATSTTELAVDYVVVADLDRDTAYVERLRGMLGDRLLVVWTDGPFDFSHKVNLGVLACGSPFVAVLNDDMVATGAGWLDQMVALAADPEVGAVGATLLFGDGTVQHAGHVYALGWPAHAYRGEPDGPGRDGELLVDREVSGVTGACLVQRREVFEQVGGWSSVFPRSYNDVDLCLKVREAGYRIVVANSVRLVHFESQSRTPEVDPAERFRLFSRWFHRMQVEEYTTAVAG